MATPPPTTIKNIVRLVAYQHIYKTSELIGAAHRAAHMPELDQQVILNKVRHYDVPTGILPKSKYDRRMVLRVRDKSREPWADVASVEVCYNRMVTNKELLTTFFGAVVRAAKAHKVGNIKIVVACRLRKS